MSAGTNTALIPNREFPRLTGDEQIERTVNAQEGNTIHVLVAENGEEAKHLFFELVPESAEIFLGASIMLETLGTNWVSTVKALS